MSKSALRALFVLWSILFAFATWVVNDARAMTPIEQTMVEQAAESAYPGAPCAGKVRVVYMGLEALRELVQNPPGDYAAGAARQGNDDGTCRIYLLPEQMDSYDLCIEYVHEYGHLDGFGHSDDPASVMYPGDSSLSFGPCMPMKTMLTSYFGKLAVKAHVGKGWRISCGPAEEHGETRTCKASKPKRATHIYYVIYLHLGQSPHLLRIT